MDEALATILGGAGLGTALPMSLLLMALTGCRRVTPTYRRLFDPTNDKYGRVGIGTCPATDFDKNPRDDKKYRIGESELSSTTAPQSSSISP